MTASRPSTRALSIALMMEPPLVTTSSTIATRAPRSMEPFDPLAGAVFLGLLADDESLDRITQPPALGNHAGDDGIGADGEPADGVDVCRPQSLDEQLRGQCKAFRVQRHPLAVEVMVAMFAGSEDEVAFHVGFFQQKLA